MIQFYGMDRSGLSASSRPCPGWLTKSRAVGNMIVTGVGIGDICEVKMVPVQKRLCTFYPPSSNRNSLACGMNKACRIIF